MDLLIRYTLVLFSAVMFAFGPSWTHVLCLTLFLVAAQQTPLHTVGLCCLYYAVAIAPLLGIAYDYSSSLSYSLLGYATVLLVNATLVSLAMLAATRYRGLAVVLALILLSVPPLASVSVVSPLPVAGVLFPGAGTVGLGLFLIIVALSATGVKPVALGMGAMALTLSQSHAVEREAVEILGIDTVRGAPSTIEAAAFAQFYRHEELELAADSNANTVVFPESTFGIWHESSGKIIAQSTTGVLGGARHFLDSTTYMNVLIDGKTGEIHYAQRYPIPWTVAGRAKPVTGRTVASSGQYNVLICNEIAHPWHAFKVFSNAQNGNVIWVANFGWTQNQRVTNRVKAHAAQWARLYGVTLIQAVNHHA